MLQILKIMVDMYFYVDCCLHYFCIILQYMVVEMGADLYSILHYFLDVLVIFSIQGLMMLLFSLALLFE